MKFRVSLTGHSKIADINYCFVEKEQHSHYVSTVFLVLSVLLIFFPSTLHLLSFFLLFFPISSSAPSLAFFPPLLFFWCLLLTATISNCCTISCRCPVFGVVCLSVLSYWHLISHECMLTHTNLLHDHDSECHNSTI